MLKTIQGTAPPPVQAKVLRIMQQAIQDRIQWTLLCWIDLMGWMLERFVIVQPSPYVLPKIEFAASIVSTPLGTNGTSLNPGEII